MVRTQVQFTTARVRRLRVAARTQDVSVAEVVRRCVDAALAPSTPKKAELYARAAGLVGAFRAGPGRDPLREARRGPRGRV